MTTSTPILDFTSYCEYGANASSTPIVKCYNPIDVQIFYLIDLLVFILAIVIIHKGWEKYVHKDPK